MEFIIEHKKGFSLIAAMLGIIISIIGFVWLASGYSELTNDKMIINDYIQTYNQYEDALNLSNIQTSINQIINITNQATLMANNNKNTNIVQNNPEINSDIQSLFNSNSLQAYESASTNSNSLQNLKELLLNQIQDNEAYLQILFVSPINMTCRYIVIGLGLIITIIFGALYIKFSDRYYV
ncbi:hypothetical protein [Clostridium thermobutyricum]|uniref:hypothetical protein n=1 Tax=Clostridium thermobutyricum TaxID=29372 RepID=UPI0018AB6042|nr:hypothetical protein [Clostridium thermobutyricum]